MIRHRTTEFCDCERFGQKPQPYPTGMCMVCGGKVVGYIEDPSKQSAQVCGCDPGAKHKCEQHR